MEKSCKKTKNAPLITELVQTSLDPTLLNKSANTLVRSVNKIFMGIKKLKNIVNSTSMKPLAFWLKQKAAGRNRQPRKELKSSNSKKKNSLKPSKDTTKVKN